MLKTIKGFLLGLLVVFAADGIYYTWYFNCKREQKSYSSYYKGKDKKTGKGYKDTYFKE